jgi:predicted Zn-dependent peptidase
VPQGEVLPGHSRPVLEHDWPHPRDLAFEDSGFRPTDAATALVTTASGVRAYVLPDTADPLVEITAVVPLGRQFEREDEVGAADAAARALGQLLADRLGDDLVARTQVSPAGDLTRITVEVLAEDWRPALAALVGALRSFDAATMTASRTGSGPGGASAARAAAELMRSVARYPIAPPDPGVEVRAEAVHRLGRRALQPGVVVLGIAGNVPRTEAEAALRAATEGWAAAPSVTPVAARAPTLAAARPLPDALHTIDVPGFMSWLAVGQPMPPIAPEDAAAVAVMKEIVNIRLNITTREIRGLTNRALLEMPAASDGAGLLYVRAGSRSESVGPIIRYAAQELSRIREAEGAPDLDELEQAKGGLVLGTWQASLDGARRTAATYATETVRHGSLEHLFAWPAAVRAVTAANVTAAARKYMDPRSLTAVVVGQIERVRAARHPRWPFALDDVPALLRPSGTGG